MPFAVTLSSNYQITTPKSVQEDQHWQTGQQLRGIAAGSDVKNFRGRNIRIYSKNL
jgi:hypothetical protein